MEIFGTNFSITLGSWRLRLGVTVEDVDAPVVRKETPHRILIVSDDTYSRREA